MWVELLIGGLGLAIPAGLVWRAYRTSKELEQRLAVGDATLLNDDRFTVDRVTLGPPGTHLIEDVQFVVVAPSSGQEGEHHG